MHGQLERIVMHPIFLKDSNVNPKVKTIEGEKVGAYSLVHNIYGVRKVCWSFGVRTRTSDKHVNHSYQSMQTKQQVG